MQSSFFRLSPDANVLGSAYVGSGDYVIGIPALGRDLGSAERREIPFSFSLTKGSAITTADYVRLQTSPDGGTTWVDLLADFDASSAANFLDGKSGLTSVAVRNVIRLQPGELVRMTASAGLTIVKAGLGL